MMDSMLFSAMMFRLTRIEASDVPGKTKPRPGPWLRILWYSHILLGQFIPAKSTYYAGIAQHGTPCADLQTRIQRVQSLMNAYQPRYQVKCVNTVGSPGKGARRHMPLSSWLKNLG